MEEIGLSSRLRKLPFFGLSFSCLVRQINSFQLLTSMKTLTLCLLLTMTVGQVANATAPVEPGKKTRSAKFTQYEIGAYVTINGKLVVSVDKQLGGRVSIQLLDEKGHVNFEEFMKPVDTTARYRLDLSNLTEGRYMLKISNGLEMVLREVMINPAQLTTRTVVLQ